MPKRKKSITQSESLFNTGAYSYQTNNHSYDSAWDTGAAFPEIHSTNPTNIDEHLSPRKNINTSSVADTTTNSTDTDTHNVSPRKNINAPEVANSTTNNQHLSRSNLLSDSDRWDSRYFGKEPPRSVDSNGQLSVLFDDSYEVPDPDDFMTPAEYEAAWKQWQQDELRCQSSQTNVLEESKKSDHESNVLGVQQFLGETMQNDASVSSTQNESFVLVNSENKYLGETIQNNTSVDSARSESFVLVNSDDKYLGETLQNDASVELLQDQTNVLVDEEYKHQAAQVNELDVLLDTERFLNETYKSGRHRKGSLCKGIEEKTLKNGIKASYPRVIGARDPDNVKHWRWAYYWEEKVDSEWRNRSLYVPIGAVSLIIGMQNNYCTVDEIISFIKKSKCKGDKKDKNKKKK
ncbi:hypothetical protein DSM106972_095520 [Dulcicalothrix desertica PCC 7102]|uniref:Uncharacterized protein n=1 Tax=Dulcicalothrix desertica PCC 7102 TaxID=232991 RepID=A0A3S1C1X8_9CYAN|nr:hypothetical protein [Dulcicalothrix desertica]RUS93793.1 hypothetical protein DSM106972_095520 [Dulcicalothrix desertica PCC 7102]TWH62728.1 hypothetical protein CAL7102_00245 [Dulcicalothrix desertica PCC 7102]